jgi:hypothetical protein
MLLLRAGLDLKVIDTKGVVLESLTISARKR